MQHNGKEQSLNNRFDLINYAYITGDTAECLRLVDAESGASLVSRQEQFLLETRLFCELSQNHWMDALEISRKLSLMDETVGAWRWTWCWLHFAHTSHHGGDEDVALFHKWLQWFDDDGWFDPAAYACGWLAVTTRPSLLDTVPILPAPFADLMAAIAVAAATRLHRTSLLPLGITAFGNNSSLEEAIRQAAIRIVWPLTVVLPKAILPASSSSSSSSSSATASNVDKDSEVWLNVWKRMGAYPKIMSQSVEGLSVRLKEPCFFQVTGTSAGDVEVPTDQSRQQSSTNSSSNSNNKSYSQEELDMSVEEREAVRVQMKSGKSPLLL